jgi:hypothetical protein
MIIASPVFVKRDDQQNLIAIGTLANGGIDLSEELFPHTDIVRGVIILGVPSLHDVTLDRESWFDKGVGRELLAGRGIQSRPAQPLKCWKLVKVVRKEPEPRKLHMRQ